MPEAVSELLMKWTDVDAAALETLPPIVYDELRWLAFRYLSRERQALRREPAVLVHDAGLRLVDNSSVSLQNRAWRARAMGSAAKSDLEH